jgi:hypothetical protein
VQRTDRIAPAADVAVGIVADAVAVTHGSVWRWTLE